MMNRCTRRWWLFLPSATNGRHTPRLSPQMRRRILYFLKKRANSVPLEDLESGLDRPCKSELAEMPCSLSELQPARHLPSRDRQRCPIPMSQLLPHRQLLRPLARLPLRAAICSRHHPVPPDIEFTKVILTSLHLPCRVPCYPEASHPPHRLYRITHSCHH